MSEAVNHFPLPAAAESSPVRRSRRLRPLQELGNRSLFLLSWAAPLLLLLLWEAFARAGVLSPQVLPAPPQASATTPGASDTILAPCGRAASSRATARLRWSSPALAAQ